MAIATGNAEQHANPESHQRNKHVGGKACAIHFVVHGREERPNLSDWRGFIERDVQLKYIHPGFAEDRPVAALGGCGDE